MAYFIRAASTAGFEYLVKYYDQNPIHLLAEAGILPSQLRNPDELISYEKLLNLLELAAQKCNISTFGLRLSANQGMKTVGLVGAYMCRQNTVQEALLVAQKYVYMHAQGMTISLELLNDGFCELKYQQLHDSSLVYPQKSQLSIGVLYRILNDLCGFKWQAQKVLFKQDANKEDKRFFEQFFNCPTEFNANVNALYFHSDYLKQKPIVHEELTNEVIFQQFESQKLTKEVGIITLVEQTIRMLLATGECNRENIALCIGIHPKKMQRTLKENNTNYQELLDNVRKKEARRVIELGNVNFTNLALNLGYADFSAFSRRFKCWYGVAPSKWNENDNEGK
jgi:AraC-like DNA-binding protein